MNDMVLLHHHGNTINMWAF